MKTHTFCGRKYKVEQVERIDGVTDVPGEPEMYEMLILNGNNLRSLHSAVHEGLEAMGLCDECLHRHDDRQDGNSRTWDLARFLWRLGYRKTE